MSTDPLPRALDIRKAAGRGASISGVLRPADLPRLRELLVGDEGSVRATLACSRDEEDRSVVALTVDAVLTVQCQRCLQPFATGLEASSTLAVVWNDEQAAALPAHLDAWIAGPEPTDIWGLVEEELVLSMPMFSYHPDTNCLEVLAGQAVAAAVVNTPVKRDNPFDVLSQLKGGNQK